MPHNKEGLRVIVDKNQQPRALRFDPKSIPLSAIKEMVNLKAQSTEETIIYMEYSDCFVYVNPARLHAINRSPQQERRKSIQQIAHNIAHSDSVLIYSATANKDS